MRRRREVGEAVLIKTHEMMGPDCAEITYQTSSGATASGLLFRDDESKLSREESTRPLSFSADPADFRLASEAQRIGEIIRDLSIDVAFVGIGENGHIAFNDPPVADFNDTLLRVLAHADAGWRRPAS